MRKDVLLIGVADDGTVVGIEPDIVTLATKPNTDGFELFLRQLLDSSLTTTTAQTVRFSFSSREHKQICQVAIAASGKPVFARPGKGSGSQAVEFWVRIGNATKQCTGTTCSTINATTGGRSPHRRGLRT